MNHDDIRHKLSEYIDGSVLPGEKVTIEEHLKTCSDCSDALDELRKTIEHIHAVEEVESPAWMTQKIMAKVRAEAEEHKTGLLSLLYNFFVLGRTIRVAAVLFLTVAAFYIYTTMHPADKYTEAPVGQLAKRESPAAAPEALKQKASEVPALREKKIAQGPGYKSLDMKYSYERPAPPSPQDRTPASEGARATESDQVGAGKMGFASGQRPAALKAAAPAAGASRRREANNVLSGDREADASRAVTEHFVNFDLPQKMKVKGLSFVIRRFETEFIDLQWMQKKTAYTSRPCTDRYVVDVDLSGKLSKYLYCYDHSRVTLLGVFELSNGNWSEIK